MPPNAPREAFRRDSAWALLPPIQKPPSPMSIQLLKVLVPPSNICSGVSGSGTAGGASVAVTAGAALVAATPGGALVPAVACGKAFVSAAQGARAPESPVRDAPRQQCQTLRLMVLSFIGGVLHRLKAQGGIDSGPVDGLMAARGPAGTQLEALGMIGAANQNRATTHALEVA